MQKGQDQGGDCAEPRGYETWAAVVVGSAGGGRGHAHFQPRTFPSSPTVRESPPSHTPGEQAFDAELVLRSMYGRVFSHLEAGDGQRIPWTGGRGDVWGDMATRRAQRHLGKVGVCLEVRRAW